jgi:hypothetical protein
VKSVGGEPRIERARRFLEVADYEGDLKGREPLERRHHGRGIYAGTAIRRDDFESVAASLRAEVRTWER